MKNVAFFLILLLVACAVYQGVQDYGAYSSLWINKFSRAIDRIELSTTRPLADAVETKSLGSEQAMHLVHSHADSGLKVRVLTQSAVFAHPKEKGSL